MTRGLEPTESYDGSITVHVLNDKRNDEKIPCASYQEAIRTVKQHRDAATATKIADRDGRIVFTSAEMELEEWVAEWQSGRVRSEASRLMLRPTSALTIVSPVLPMTFV